MGFSFVQALVTALGAASIRVESVKLEGSGASHVVHKTAFPTFNDLDIVLHLTSPERSDLTGVRDILFSLLQQQLPEDWMSRAQIWDVSAALISKMWISPPRTSETEDSWALFTLGGTLPCSKAIDLKIVQHIQRPYQFSIDSLRIDLTDLLSHRNQLKRSLPTSNDKTVLETDIDPSTGNCSATDEESNESREKKLSASDSRKQPTPSNKTSWAAIAAPRAVESQQLIPENKTDGANTRKMDADILVTVDSAFEGGTGVNDAIEHLSRRYISVKNEDEMASIRGGGLLKFVSYLLKGFTLDPAVDKHRLLKYMVTRFLMDYPSHAVNKYGIPVQLQVLSDYIRTHFSIAICGAASPSMEIGSMRQRFLHQLLLNVKAVQAYVNLCDPLLNTISYLMHCISQQMVSIQRTVAMAVATAQQKSGMLARANAAVVGSDLHSGEEDLVACNHQTPVLDAQDLTTEMREMHLTAHGDNGDNAADDCDSCSIASEDSVGSSSISSGNDMCHGSASAAPEHATRPSVMSELRVPVHAFGTYNDLAAAVAVPLFYTHPGINTSGNVMHHPQFYNQYSGQCQEGSRQDHVRPTRTAVPSKHGHHQNSGNNSNGGKGQRGRKTKQHPKHLKARSKSTPAIQRNQRASGNSRPTEA